MTADSFLLSKSDLLPTSQDERLHAETLAGRAINAVHDAFSSAALLSSQERQARAQHSDQLAEVVADSLAMLPGLRLPAAGLLRATALANVSGDWSKLATNYAKDFVEGAALNKVSNCLLPEGTLGKRITEGLGAGLRAEAVSFAAAGAGMASVTTAFRQDTWLDENKNFSTAQGGMAILKAGIVGGAMSVPAGIIGSRISRTGLAWGSEGRISSTSALAIAGLGSGYLSGTAIGGVQGLLAGGDLKTVLASMNEGGIAGALSGAVGMSALAKLPGLKPVTRVTAESIEGPPAFQDATNRLISCTTEVSAAERDALIRGNNESTSNPDLGPWKSLEIQPNKLNDSESSLSDRVQMLGVARKGVLVRYYIATENAEEIAAASKDLKEFQKKGGMQLVEDSVRMYEVAGQTITIPESYAQRLDEVLALRLKVAEGTDLYVRGPAHAKEVLQARLDLDAHPLKDKAHPADLVHLLSELPDRSLVKDLFIREDRSPTDAWIAREYEPGFRAAATAGQEDSRITFYNADRSSLLRNYMKHEWGHLLKWAAASESSRFDQAAVLEKDGYFVSNYAKRNNDENWAEHVASLLDPDPDKFLDTAHSAPLRTVEMGRALLKSLSAVPRGLSGDHQAEIANRIAYIQNNVMPEAQSGLLEHMGSGNKENAIMAAGLLDKMGGKDEFNLLADMARTQPNAGLREAAFTAAWGKIIHGRTVSSGYNEVTLKPQISQMRDFLVSQAAPGAKSREIALDFLSKMRDSGSRFYYDLLTMDHVKENRLSCSLALMDRAPDNDCLRLAWQEALKSAAGNPEQRVNLALSTLGTSKK